MNRLIEKDQTLDLELESIMESLASREIDAETAKKMIAAIVGSKKKEKDGNYDCYDSDICNNDFNVDHNCNPIDS